MDTVNPNPDVIKQWEELRRRARQHENELDQKISAFSDLMKSRNDSKKSTTISSAGNRYGSGSFESEPLLDSQDNFERLSTNIETLLNTLLQVDSQMERCRQQMPASNAVGHTLQRHQEILKDYRNEFNKIRTTLEQQMTRDRLLVRNNDMGDFPYSENRKSNDYLMKERDHIQSSEIMIDDQINIALRTRDTLRSQRSAMKSIQTQLTTLANKFPMLNNVMQRIGVKKRKDSIILAIVIAVCLFLLILYLF